MGSVREICCYPNARLLNKRTSQLHTCEMDVGTSGLTSKLRFPCRSCSRPMDDDISALSRPRYKFRRCCHEALTFLTWLYQDPMAIKKRVKVSSGGIEGRFHMKRGSLSSEIHDGIY